MALLPTIPTSFVPHGIPASHRQPRSDFTGAFSLLAYAVLAICFALAVGVFFYGRILASGLSAKDAELAKAEAAIDPATVDSFVRLHTRLDSGATLLAKHSAFTDFFAALEALLPSTVRFTSLHAVIDNTNAAKMEGTGVAKSFNALSVASGKFATDGRIRDAIFSKIRINRDRSVSFGFSATLDPRLMTFSPGTAEPSTAAASTTPSL